MNNCSFGRLNYTSEIMTRNIYLLVVLGLTLAQCTSSSSGERSVAESKAAIRKLLSNQALAWSNGSIDLFMEGYWKSDSLQFVSSRGISKSWQTAIERYKRSYLDKEAMGTLDFEILQVRPIGSDVYLVTGKFHLTRTIGDLQGAFTLLAEIKDGKWVITYDHTS